ncbi:uncharacterized protein LOC119072123 [Bradysia coprophila]|uniref:uncharacterized protein LOC119072123 n=1 Tax=Bradysia coprophila TaxID=38358 RepID=UPI00187DCF7C|nr:uncharacterized protein LOC119072123 [Bradysia coprophila]
MEKLAELSASTNAVKVVMSGMGGVGKTQIARKFIEENRSKYANVIWINSETEQAIIDAFKKLSEDTLQLSTINANGKEKDFSTVIEQVLHKLCQRKTLFVYDNVDSMQSMNVVLAMAPPPTEQKPHVFITSRLQRWPTGITVMLLDFWSPAEAFQFISKAVNDPHYDTDDDRNLLANTMQYFPLALRQATAYINQQRVFDHFKISQYVSEYMRNRRQMLQSKIFQTDSNSPYQNTTYSTWSITIDTIRNVNLNGLGQLAIRIFNIIAYFQPDLLERKWFFHLNFDDENQQADQKVEERIKSAVDLLIKYCMIDSQDKQESFNIHRLVQEVTKFNLKELHEEESIMYCLRFVAMPFQFSWLPCPILT